MCYLRIFNIFSNAITGIDNYVFHKLQNSLNADYDVYIGIWDEFKSEFGLKTIKFIDFGDCYDAFIHPINYLTFLYKYLSTFLLLTFLSKQNSNFDLITQNFYI